MPDRYDDMAAEMLPCVEPPRTLPAGGEGCVVCNARPAVAAKLREMGEALQQQVERSARLDQELAAERETAAVAARRGDVATEELRVARGRLNGIRLALEGPEHSEGHAHDKIQRAWEIALAATEPEAKGRPAPPEAP